MAEGYVSFLSSCSVSREGTIVKRFKLALPPAVLLVTLTSLVAQAAAPPLPASFYGTVTIAGQNVRSSRQSAGW